MKSLGEALVTRADNVNSSNRNLMERRQLFTVVNPDSSGPCSGLLYSYIELTVAISLRRRAVSGLILKDVAIHAGRTRFGHRRHYKTFLHSALRQDRRIGMSITGQTFRAFRGPAFSGPAFSVNQHSQQ